MKTIGTKEWAPNNENCIEGCENDCIYCYAAESADRYKPRPPLPAHQQPEYIRSGKTVAIPIGQLSLEVE